ncbi:TetR/AcrR family transcriptional regulator [Heyndrickxia sp. NPDC080065]|uniref:TetR/AcrR family transcriptional regulator n=1 Tax=Heyndrickxia sp. NPDC080065 TaxID=3390568 RepID=UPI003D06D897
MDGYQRRTEKKKESIRKAAFELFSIYGIDKVSIGEIAKKANVSPVTIYNYFGSKEELIKDVFIEYMNKEILEFTNLIHSDLSFPQKLEKVIFEKREAAKLFNKEFFQSIIDPSLKDVVEEYLSSTAIPLTMELLEIGRKEGYVNPAISSEAIILYIHKFSELTQYPDLFEKYDKDVILDLSNLFFYGLLGQPVQKD